MAYEDPKTLVSTDWLASHLQDPDLRLLDASWYLPNMNRNAREEYDAEHIPGARFFDIDEINHGSDLPHMVPPVEKFCHACERWGLVMVMVVYDGEGLFSAARLVAL